ncbi:MAG: hypothetical protein KatS3mg111_3217 [Pirellulaceae bacterium]|nr:MAG: hypothetical protein KatS3mg111_3217 [Pirellulaceae bacterium]
MTAPYDRALSPEQKQRGAAPRPARAHHEE